MKKHLVVWRGVKNGYNIFKSKENGDIKREVRFETFTAKTRFKEIDGIESYHLKYETYNDGLNGGVRDEIRKINDNLYLGIGSASWVLGLRIRAFLSYMENLMNGKILIKGNCILCLFSK